MSPPFHRYLRPSSGLLPALPAAPYPAEGRRVAGGTLPAPAASPPGSTERAGARRRSEEGRAPLPKHELWRDKVPRAGNRHLQAVPRVNAKGKDWTRVRSRDPRQEKWRWGKKRRARESGSCHCPQVGSSRSAVRAVGPGQLGKNHGSLQERI